MCLLCIAASTLPAGAAASAAAHPKTGTAPGFIVAEFVNPVLVSVFGVPIYNYGTMVALALGLAFLVFAKELKRARIHLDEMSCFFVFLGGFAVGSKAHLALSAVGAGEELSWKSLDIRTGHSFIGSQLGAVLSMLVYITRNGVGVLAFLDVLLPCCMLGHVVGKVGCFLSGDGCYGPAADPQNVPWAMSFPNGLIPTEEPVHPTPIYESLCSLVVFAAARILQPLPDEGEENPCFPAIGRRTALVLVLYGIERVIIEQYRRHPPIDLFGGLTEYQVLALALLGVGALIEVFGRRWRKDGLSPIDAQKKEN